LPVQNNRKLHPEEGYDAGVEKMSVSLLGSHTISCLIALSPVCTSLLVFDMQLLDLADVVVGEQALLCP
jgi:hypothetical protein